MNKRNKRKAFGASVRFNSYFVFLLVLQGLMEVKSPYLEELLSLLMTVGTQNGAAGPVAMVISLLLQEGEERTGKKEVDTKR